MRFGILERASEGGDPMGGGQNPRRGFLGGRSPAPMPIVAAANRLKRRHIGARCARCDVAGLGPATEAVISSRARTSPYPGTCSQTCGDPHQPPKQLKKEADFSDAPPRARGATAWRQKTPPPCVSDGPDALRVSSPRDVCRIAPASGETRQQRQSSFSSWPWMRKVGATMRTGG